MPTYNSILLLRNYTKKYFMKNDSPIGFFKSVTLFLIAFTLLVTTAPFGFLYTVLRQIMLRQIKSLNIFFVQVALALDVAGNVMMQHLLNDILLVRNHNTYYFGNAKETISSVIGKNSLTNTLSFLGICLNDFLNFLDKNHSLNSIIYDIRAWQKQREAQ